MRLLHAERKKCAPAYASVTQAITRCACGEARCCGDGLYSEGLCGAGGSASAGAGDDDEPEREPGAQALGCCRRKSCRSDVAGGNRTFSHCCSDKIMRWSAEGCQGALLRRWVRLLRFAKAVLSHDASPRSVAERPPRCR